MADLSADTRAVVEAIHDLTRVTIALHGNFASKSDAIRGLTELSIPPARVAAILAMQLGDVHSALAKAKKRASSHGADARKSVRDEAARKPVVTTQGATTAPLKEDSNDGQG